MFLGLDLYYTDPAQHVISASLGSTTVDDLDRDLSHECNFFRIGKSW